MKIDLNKAYYDGEENFERNVAVNDKPKTIATEGFVIDDQLDKGGDNIPILAVKRENARSKIAFLYVSSFLAIIILVFAFSVFSRLNVDGVKDLLLAVSGILSGPLGFIIGYYFKVEEDIGA